LNPEQRQLLIHYLEQGAIEHGFPADRWTQARIAELIEDKFGIAFCPFHVGRILAAEGWDIRHNDPDNPDISFLPN
jgi:transposase